MGGMFIYEEVITGTVVKTNAKSIRVHMVHIKYLTNGELTREHSMDEVANFKLWKTNVDGTVNIYKNPKYGVIKIVR
jgi:hypothetical protein